MDVAASMDA